MNIKKDEFIMATLLGDACIPKLGKGAKTNRWCCGHGERQLEYLKWKVDYFVKENLHTGVITKCTSYSDRYKKPCISYHTKTRGNIIFNEYRDIFYPNGYKIFPQINMTPEMLSILYMDDGHLLKINTYYKDRVYTPTPKAIFNLQSFSDIERDYLCKEFAKYGIKATSRNKNGEVAISSYSMNDFRKLIKVLPIFEYKMGPV